MTRMPGIAMGTVASPWATAVGASARVVTARQVDQTESPSASPLRLGKAAAMACLALTGAVTSSCGYAPAVAHSTVSQEADVPFHLQKGDRLAIVGDSITEQRRYARMVETYLTVVRPDLEIEVRNHGKGGEAAWDLIDRMDREVLPFHPTVATLAYGMNDSTYSPYSKGSADLFHTDYATVVRKFEAAHVRVVVGTDGPVSKRPPWVGPDVPAVALNQHLEAFRDQAVEVARDSHEPYADAFGTLTRARQTGLEKYGADYAENLCGTKDGVHPDWAGHVPIAYSFLKSLGLDGNVGVITVDLRSGQATASEGHHIETSGHGRVVVTSRRYPFVAEGAADRTDSVRSGMTLVPFNDQLNRFTLQVKGATAARYKVTWGDSSRTYSANELSRGINLAADFQHNPFSAAFHRVDEAVAAKQAVESDEVWRVFDGHAAKPDLPQTLRQAEAQRTQRVAAIHDAFVPVRHVIQITPVS